MPNVMDEIEVDTAKVDNYRMWYKNVQEWYNMRGVTLFYGPTPPPMGVILADVLKLFTES